MPFFIRVEVVLLLFKNTAKILQSYFDRLSWFDVVLQDYKNSSRENCEKNSYLKNNRSDDEETFCRCNATKI